jgi:hypothetical protein
VGASETAETSLPPRTLFACNESEDAGGRLLTTADDLGDSVLGSRGR